MRHYRAEQVVLVLKIIVDVALGCMRGRRDVSHRRLLEPFLQKLVAGRGDDAFPDILFFKLHQTTPLHAYKYIVLFLTFLAQGNFQKNRGCGTFYPRCDA
ncbi:hypothetical protein SDC9_168059 [bioreactor metagenome]|uniref:Uncharacterized protein n=1 Tax=bioreactor metagenome TaxID=1076179 RepID=A0A645G436_9ZZZZ